jgi:hypothetical protein
LLLGGTAESGRGGGWLLVLSLWLLVRLLILLRSVLRLTGVDWPRSSPVSSADWLVASGAAVESGLGSLGVVAGPAAAAAAAAV